MRHPAVACADPWDWKLRVTRRPPSVLNSSGGHRQRGGLSFAGHRRPADCRRRLPPVSNRRRPSCAPPYLRQAVSAAAVLDSRVPAKTRGLSPPPPPSPFPFRHHRGLQVSPAASSRGCAVPSRGCAVPSRGCTVPANYKPDVASEYLPEFPSAARTREPWLCRGQASRVPLRPRRGVQTSRRATRPASSRAAASLPSRPAAERGGSGGLEGSAPCDAASTTSSA
ncbi:unnamed protein product, partial [Ectocarpus sp. 8 AP-2014]